MNQEEKPLCSECGDYEEDCFCNAITEEDICDECSGVDGKHHYLCQYDVSGYGHLLRHGYD